MIPGGHIRLLLCLLLAVGTRANGLAGGHAGRGYLEGGHFSLLNQPDKVDQLNKNNVANLHLAWTYHAGGSSNELATSMECTPLVVGDVMYVTSPVMKVIALNTSTGREIWSYNPFPEEPSYAALEWKAAFSLLLLLIAGYSILRFWRARFRRPRVVYTTCLLVPMALLSVGANSLADRVIRHILPDPRLEQRHAGPNRGVSYWQSGSDKRILFAGGHKLVALDATTGRPVAGFGKDGVVDLTKGLGRKVDGQAYSISSPGVVYKDLIAIGSMMSEGPGPVPPGDVRAFDVRTGEQRWVFHTIPHPGETGYDTWPADAWQHMGGANDWAGMTLDKARGLLFLPISSAAFDYYGGDRTGQNLFTDSVVAVKADTGKLVWYYQTIHHDLWDYDVPCAPVLVNIQRDGKPVDALVQPTKQGFLFVLDRETGEPLFPVEERPVPTSTVPNEHAWPTQPFPVKPAPLNRLAITEADLTDLSPEAHADALTRFRQVASATIFTPPSQRGNLVVPGFQGGANWGGAVFDPVTANLIVNTSELPYLLRVIQNTPSQVKAGFPYTVQNFSEPFIDASGYPAIKPPWGMLVAVNLNTGGTSWKVPLGEYAELSKRGLPATGTPNVGGAVLTPTGIAFIAATKDHKFRAFDASTGKVLWETTLNAAGHATPALYQANGKQYVVIAAGGGSIAGSAPSGDEYIAFCLPDKGTL